MKQMIMFRANLKLIGIHVNFVIRFENQLMKEILILKWLILKPWNFIKSCS